MSTYSDELPENARSDREIECAMRPANRQIIRLCAQPFECIAIVTRRRQRNVWFAQVQHLQYEPEIADDVCKYIEDKIRCAIECFETQKNRLGVYPVYQKLLGLMRAVNPQAKTMAQRMDEDDDDDPIAPLTDEQRAEAMQAFLNSAREPAGLGWPY
jgi:hypothetical protein